MRGESRLGRRDDVTDRISSLIPIELGYYDERYITRRIEARLRRTGATGVDEYLTLLEHDRKERSELVESLSINVTGFFRNPAMWRALQPILRDRTARNRVRVWSAPCADGREPYSVALLALDDPQIDAQKLRVVGTDVSEEALAMARSGEYRCGTTNDIEDELSLLRNPDRFVTRNGETFRVGDRVKSLIEFRRHDLIHDDPLNGMDIVLCRNLLIYIHPEYESAVFETVSSSLNGDGILVVGMTESSAPERSTGFEPLDRGNRIYQKT